MHEAARYPINLINYEHLTRSQWEDLKKLFIVLVVSTAKKLHQIKSKPIDNNSLNRWRNIFFVLCTLPLKLVGIIQGSLPRLSRTEN